MSSRAQDVVGQLLTRDQVLAELEFLAEVEHALVARQAMDALDAINHARVQRSLLPPFTATSLRGLPWTPRSSIV